ncbi:MAG: methyltransferase domain-containing protein [Pseudomonadota bacterium]
MAERNEWSGDLGAAWAGINAAMDAQLAPVLGPAIQALAPKPGERIIDLGCGGGASSLEIAHAVGPEGRVLGLDISPDLAEIARARGRDLPQLEIVTGDAARHPFETPFDALFTRFGCMFFEDPPAAMGHLRQGLRPGGRALLTVWAEPEHNPWAMVPAKAAAMVLGPAEKLPPGAPGPFGWASPAIFEPILAAAGFRDLTVAEMEVEMEIGHGGGSDPVARAVAAMTTMGPLGRRLQEAPEAKEEASAVLAGLLAAHIRDGAVRLGGRIRLLSAIA